MNPMARRMFELVEPIGAIPYSFPEVDEAMYALGFTDFWDTYFAGRAAPLGEAPAEVVDALFYNFAPGEVARHVPSVWRTATPDAALDARLAGCVAAMQRVLGDRVHTSQVAGATELLLRAGTSASMEGRPMYAALRALAVPEEPRARLFHAAALLREHRGDGHVVSLVVEGVGRLEAHVLYALDLGMPADAFGRLHHLPRAQIADVVAKLHDRGLVAADGWLSEDGRTVRRRVEDRTDDLAAEPYGHLEPHELEAVDAALEPLASLLVAARQW